MSDLQRYGARGPLNSPPQLGEYEVVLAWQAEAAIAAARANMFAKCIAAVEEVHSPIQHGEDTYCRGCADAAYNEFSFTWPCPVVTSVRALQEKP